VERARQLVSEYLGSALLALTVVGSGIAAQKLSPHNTGLQLLENSVVTAAGLYVLINVFGPLSGAHFNPVVSFADVMLGKNSLARALSYCPVQVAGCISGSLVANILFGLPVAELSTHQRCSGPHFVSEVIATAGLVMVIFVLARNGSHQRTASSVACYIGAAYFFTSSTSFANPAIVVGRMFSNSFAGIAPSSAPGFVLAEVIGGLLGVALVSFLYPREVTNV